ncbi:hypothetical protein PF008_g32602, partial [Phytophthora fragariae]
MRIWLLVRWWFGWGLRAHGFLAFVQRSERASTRTRGASSCSVLSASLPAVSVTAAASCVARWRAGAPGREPARTSWLAAGGWCAAAASRRTRRAVTRATSSTHAHPAPSAARAIRRPCIRSPQRCEPKRTHARQHRL